VIPSLLGRTDQLMIGRVLSDEFFANRDWPVASAVAILILVLLVVPIIAVSTRTEERAGGHRETGLFLAHRTQHRACVLVRADSLNGDNFPSIIRAWLQSGTPQIRRRSSGMWRCCRTGQYCVLHGCRSGLPRVPRPEPSFLAHSSVLSWRASGRFAAALSCRR